jgi:hypothetical protein
MAVPVVLGRTSFDYAPLRSDQSRLAKTMVVPSPRDKDDTAQVFEVVDNQATPFKYPTFIKTFFDKPGSLPRFELWMKDNFDAEFSLSQGVAATQPINFLNGASLSTVPANYVVSPVTGEINRGGTINPATGLITGGTQVGTVKFDGVTGLALAAINTRIADISNAVEGMTKILGIVSSNMAATMNLIR